jgi:hypothetical protein
MWVLTVVSIEREASGKGVQWTVFYPSTLVQAIKDTNSLRIFLFICLVLRDLVNAFLI